MAKIRKRGKTWQIDYTDLDDGLREDGPTSDDQAALKRLRRENARLREEQEILKTAAAWFARETDSVPEKGTHS